MNTNIKQWIKFVIGLIIGFAAKFGYDVTISEKPAATTTQPISERVP